MRKITDKLKLKVDAVNLAGKEANLIYPELVTVFTPFLGKTVLKATGELRAEVAKRLPILPNTPNLRIYRHFSEYSLAYCVKACASSSDNCVYHEIVVYIAELRDGMLTKFCSPFACRCDFTAEQIAEQIEQVEAANKAYRAAVSALYPFGESDN